MKSLILVWQQFPEWIRLALPVCLWAMLVAMAVMPLILHACSRFALYDHPGGRKLHQNPKPTMGGLAVFAGTLSGLMLIPAPIPLSLSLLFCFCTITFTGAIDDCRNLRPAGKLFIQTIIAAITASADLRLHSLHGLFGVHLLPLFWQYLLTILFITGIINAYNLIDGVDGLAGGIALISLAVLGFILLLGGETSWGLFAFALIGGLLGFLYFNVQPARIFMGDTGSLLLGFCISLLCLRLLQVHDKGSSPMPQPLLATFAVVALPVMDAARLFATRLCQGRSPFMPDSNHMHHLLTGKGWTHSATTLLLMLFHFVLVLSGFLLQQTAATTAFLQLMLLPVLAYLLLQRLPVLVPRPEKD